jgi:hypothetical protein
VAIKTFRCRFFPNHAPTPGRGELTEYLVPVSWWSYDDFPVTWGRMDDRGPAVQTGSGGGPGLQPQGGQNPGVP